MRRSRWVSLCFGLASVLSAAATPEGLKVKAIAASANSSVAVAADGTVWEWGGFPSRVSGLSDITAVAAGTRQSLALKDDGTVWSWQAGSAAAQVSGLTGAPVVAIGVNGNFAVALKGDGTVWTWGGTTCGGQPLAPAQVSGLAAITAVAAGPGFYLAVKSDGTVWVWRPVGCGYTDSPAPSQVSGLNSIVSVVVAGGATGVALKLNGTIWEWRIDLNSPNQNSSPPAQVSVLNDVTAIAAGSGGGHRLALKRDGTVWARGGNDYGQLGNGTTSGNWYESSPPVQVSGLGTVTAIAAGNFHSLALQADGTLWAWGGDFGGQLGIGVPARPIPGQVRGLNGVTTVAAALGGSCRNLALKGDGTVWEWGTLSLNMSPPVVQVSGLSDVQAISAAGWCMAVKHDGTVWTWGVRYGSPSETAPAQIEGLDHIVAVSRVALRGDGTVWEDWGKPVQVAGLNRVVAVAAYWSWGFGNLALKDDGTVWQWAVDEDERYDLYNGPLALEPEQVDGLTGIVAIAGGDIATALKRDGTVWEWSDRAMTRQRTGVNDVTAIAVGIGYSVAVKRDGTVWIWSRVDNGQLGRAPVQVPALSDVKAIAAGSINGSALAVKRDGTVWSSGGGPDQLGEEWIAIRTTPVAVVPLGAPDLAIAMSHDGDFTVGDKGIYKLTLTNVGLTATSGMITVTDMLPPGVTWITATGSDWGCSVADQVVTCANPVQIEPGASSSIGLVVEVGSAAWPGVTNLAVVSNETDRNGANNAGWDPTVVLQRK